MDSTAIPIDAEVPRDDLLVIRFSDGTTRAYPLDRLRAACPCAACVDEWTGEVRVSVDMFPNVTLKELEEVGRYAFRIGFSDGHRDGLFTYARLRNQLGEPVEEV